MVDRPGIELDEGTGEAAIGEVGAGKRLVTGVSLFTTTFHAEGDDKLRAVFAACRILDEDSKPYFRESREAMFGRSLEEIHADEASAKAGLAIALEPFAEALGAYEFLGGDDPTYPDYVLFGLLIWADIVSPYRPIDDSGPVGEWFVRLENLHDGYAANVPTERALAP